MIRIDAELLRELSRYPRFPATAELLINLVDYDGAAEIISAWPGQKWPAPVVPGGVTPAGRMRYEQLVELIGGDKARRISEYFCGGDMYVPNLKEVWVEYTAGLIREEFDVLIRRGYSAPEAVFELGLKYGFSGRHIETVVASPNSELRDPVISEQQPLF